MNMNMAVNLNVTRLVGLWNKYPYPDQQEFLTNLMRALRRMGFDTIYCPAWSAWHFYLGAAEMAGMRLVAMLPGVSCTEQTPHADLRSVADKIALYSSMLGGVSMPAVWYNDDSGSLSAGDCMVLEALDGLGIRTVWTPPVHRLGHDVTPPLSTEIVGQIYLASSDDPFIEGFSRWEALRSRYPSHRRGVFLQTYGGVPERLTLRSLHAAKAVGATTAACFCAVSDQWPDCLFNWQKIADLPGIDVPEDCWTSIAHEVQMFTGGGDA